MLHDTCPEGLKEKLINKGGWALKGPLMLAIDRLKGGKVRFQGIKGTLENVIMETVDVDK